MRSIRKIIRSTILYVMSLVLIAGAPLTAFAQEAPLPDAPTSVVTTEEPPQSTPPPADTLQTEELPQQQAPPESPPQTDQAQDTQQQAVTNPTTEDSAASTQSTTSETSSKNTATIENTQHSTAVSGNAVVTQNTRAGNATTGGAVTETTIVNTVQSTIGNGDATSIAHFTTDIHGNVYGDITIAPSINSATQLLNANASSLTNVDNDTSIANTVTASATTGDATVDSNTNAGNATTGNAHAVANIMNLINTIIAANRSFVGTINIYGDLNGDILVSPEFIPQLLGTNQSSANVDTTLSANIENNQQIVNNIQLQATTGSAAVDSNTNAGNATTGTAATNLTVLNLTGHEVTAANSLLVFVNVLGTWIGMIVDAPAGTTSALIGNGVTHSSVTTASALNVSNDAKITNNVDLAAASGDAAVTRNTNAGNATSGNATASANIANIATSTFSISDWFGVLFINVFGTWQGSFGINTANGDVIALSPDIQPGVYHPAAPQMQFGFTPKVEKTSTLRTAVPGSVLSAATVTSATNSSEYSDEPTVRFADAVLDNSSTPVTPANALRQTKSPHDNTTNLVMILVGLGITAFGLAIAGSRRFF